jgi:hypothetical protein
MSQNISPEAALKVLEVVTNRVGAKIETEERFATVKDMVFGVNMAFIQLIDAAENAPQLIADKLVDLSAVCAIAVASMVAGVEVSTQVSAPKEEPQEQLTEAEKRAFDAMQDRMKKMREQAGSFLS